MTGLGAPGLGVLWARRLFLFLLAVFLVAPLVVVAGVSFNGNARMSFPPEHPGLLWYRTFVGDPAWMAAFRTSLLVATAAAVLAMLVALPICYAAWKYRSAAARLLRGVGLLSFALPPVVLGIVFLVFWSALGHVGHVEDTIISHAVVFVALPLATLGLGFRAIDPALVQAAQTMGARDNDVLRTVVLPLVLPYIVSGLVFVFILSLNEYIIAYMVAGFTVETLPIKVFNNLRMGFQPTMCVGAVLFVLVGVAGFSAVALVGDLPKLLGGEG